MKKSYSRREFIRVAGLGATASFLAACGAGGAQRTAATPTPGAPDPTAEPTAEAAAPTAEPTAEQAAAAPVSEEEAQAAAEVVVGDVMDYVLSSPEWPGDFGFVVLQLHEAFYNGDMVYHIRTDASDAAYAQEIGLVHVPLLNAALSREEATSPLYMVENGVDEQRSVFATVPGMDSFSPALRLHRVTFNGSPTLLDSVEAIEAAEADGDITIEKQDIVVNYPLIKWPEGGLTVDTDLEAALANGQLFEEVDGNNLQVRMKLHQCYPGSRYIVTDTSTPDMAPMMNIAASPPTAILKEVAATDEIWVFGNGLAGPGVMGFQPAIFDNKATEPAWSPFWDHFTVVWQDEAAARILRSSDEVRAAIEAGELEQFNGVPDSHPNGFVVNCPAPILAPNTYSPA